jgi:hypothetical protein
METAESEAVELVDLGGLFGIDLGHRGGRSDAPQPEAIPVPMRVRAKVRTLTERLASAAAERIRTGVEVDEDIRRRVRELADPAILR